MGFVLQIYAAEGGLFDFNYQPMPSGTMGLEQTTERSNGQNWKGVVPQWGESRVVPCI